MEDLLLKDIKRYIDEKTLEKLLKEYGLSRESDHEKRVSRYALQIFDFLSPDFGLSDKDRNMLELSTWFHDIGHVISVQKHDYHTRNLIMEDQGFNILSKKLRSTLALIAGGHRKKIGGEIENHSKKRQEVILKLAAILRIADAIDYYRMTDIKIVNMHWRNETFVITMQGSMLDYIFARIAKKSALFEEVFAPIRPEQKKGE